MKYVWSSQLILLLVLAALACGPESLEPTNDPTCHPSQWKVYQSQTLYQETLAPGKPGAIGCLRVTWGAPQQAKSYQVKLFSDGKILPKVKEPDVYTELPITLPNEVRGQSLSFQLFVYGSRFQSGGSATPDQASALCLEMQDANFTCNSKPGDTCWLSMNVPNAKTAEGQKPASCEVSINPNIPTEPTGPEWLPESSTEPPTPTEPPPLPDQDPPDSSVESPSSEPPDVSEPPAPTELPPLPDQDPPDSSMEPISPDQPAPTEPGGPELPPEPVTEALTDISPLDGGRPDRVAVCTPGTKIACPADPSKFGVCQEQEQICLSGGLWSLCQPVVHTNPPPEICDSEDNDCDGQIDEGNVCKLPTPCTPAPCIYTLAGINNVGKFGNIDGAADQAAFNQPRGIAIDAKGNIYISEVGNHRIRILYPNGQVGTFAGGGTVSNATTARRTAQFNLPYDLAFGPSGHLYVTDRGNGRLRYIDIQSGFVYIKSSPALAIPTVMTYEPTTQTLFIADDTKKQVFYLKAGNLASFKNAFTDVTSLLSLNNNQLLFTEFLPSCIGEFSPVTLQPSATPYAGTCSVSGFQDSTRPKALFDGPTDMAKDSLGNLYIYDEQYRRIRKIDTSGNVTTIVNQSGNNLAGFKDGPAETAQFKGKIRIAIDGQDNMIIADTENNVIRKLVLK